MFRFRHPLRIIQHRISTKTDNIPGVHMNLFNGSRPSLMSKPPHKYTHKPNTMSPPPPPQPPIEYGYMNRIMEQGMLLKQIDNRYKKLLIGCGVVVVSGAGCSYLYYDELKNYLTSESTDVATNTMKDPSFQEQTIKLSSDTVAQLCQDPMIQEKLTELLVIALNTDEVKNAATEMVKEVLQNPEVKDEAARFASEIVTATNVKSNTQNTLEDIVSDPDFKDKVSSSLYDVISDALTPSLFRKSNKDNNVKQNDNQNVKQNNNQNRNEEEDTFRDIPHQ